MMTAVVTDKRNGSEVRYENVVRVEKVGHVIEIHFSDWTHEVHSDTCTVFLEFSDSSVEIARYICNRNQKRK